jgi:hypothetical protein
MVEGGLGVSRVDPIEIAGVIIPFHEDTRSSTVDRTSEGETNEAAFCRVKLDLDQ